MIPTEAEVGQRIIVGNHTTGTITHSWDGRSWGYDPDARVYFVYVSIDQIKSHPPSLWDMDYCQLIYPDEDD